MHQLWTSLLVHIASVGLDEVRQCQPHTWNKYERSCHDHMSTILKHNVTQRQKLGFWYKDFERVLTMKTSRHRRAVLYPWPPPFDTIVFSYHRGGGRAEERGYHQQWRIWVNNPHSSTTRYVRLFGGMYCIFYDFHDDVIKWKHFPRYWCFVRDRWIPLTKASNAEFWCFLWSGPEEMSE